MSARQTQPRPAPPHVADVLRRANSTLIVRGWLSSNSIVFTDSGETSTVVDTGYASHAAQTVSLITAALEGRSLNRIVNTHLHSDHCGGNSALQARFPGVITAVPIGFQTAVAPWRDDQLSFATTGQTCPPFKVDNFIVPGQEIHLGGRIWQSHSAPGHDPHALMFYEPIDRVLISGDALWEQRLAIIFPELMGDSESGFDAAGRTLSVIERMNPRCVLPGHGAAFTQVQAAIKRSRERLEAFAAHPSRHRDHAMRALVMFHMLEHRAIERADLEAWMIRTPVFAGALQRHANQPIDDTASGALQDYAAQVIDSLLADRVLQRCGARLDVRDEAQR